MNERWSIIRDGRAIEWNVAPGDDHTDDIEMAGFLCSHIVKYGMENDNFVLSHHTVFPTLRLRPNNTHASYQLDIPDELLPRFTADGEFVKETLVKAVIDGVLTLICTDDTHGLQITHICFPSPECRAAYEIVKVANIGNVPVKLVSSCDNPANCKVNETMGPMGINICEVESDFEDGILAAGEEYSYSITITGRTAFEEKDCDDAWAELDARRLKVETLTSPMKLDTGNEVLDTMFRFAKLRAGESVFDTMYGLIHSPGGMSYYAATWCNDQVEYAGPYFAYTGNPDLLEASMNAYRMYMPFMSDSYMPIPSSVIAEGIDYWNGAGDRGDAAMYLYGASRFALTSGDRDLAAELLPAIEWCAEYCKRQMNEGGVISSDRDELEGRFPSGNANLCTSTLAYGGLLALASLERDAGKPKAAEEYEKRASALRASIESYFGSEIHGYNAYKYYKECTVLRSWICMPLCVGIYDRAKDTVDALTSEYLLKPDGLLTTEENNTIWDRSTLYGLRGIFASGFTAKGAELLLRYCSNRLLGERVPYAVEAYPEGGRRHLSGESALFCKVITEGILDMIPTGLRSFTIKPTLPEGFDHLYLTNIEAHGAVFGVYLEKDGYTVVKTNGEILARGANGEQTEVNI